MTTAHVLASSGHRVSVHSREPYVATTSAIATAMWHIYMVDPSDQVVVSWAHETLRKLVSLERLPECGIELVSGVELFRFGPVVEPPFRRFAPGYSVLTPEEMRAYPGRSWGYRLTTPVANMKTYLRWLYTECLKVNVEFRQHDLSSLDELPASDAIVNCAGLGSRELAGDDSMYGLRGQYAVFRDRVGLGGAYVGDDENPKGMAYFVPRDGEILVGGTEERSETLVFEQDVDALLDRAFEFCSIAPERSDLLRTEVGLRPCRADGRVRVELDSERPDLVHNYGHGGSGFSLSWGCASAVGRVVAVM